MKVEGEYTFDARREEVWPILLDPAVLTTVLPGCEKLELVGEDSYEGVLKIKVGPVQGVFKGKIKLEDIEEPQSYTMLVDGRGAPGFVKATGRVNLEEEAGQTRMVYSSDAQVGGRLASVGQRLMESSAKAIIKQSLDGLNAALLAHTAAAKVTATDDGESGEEEAAAAEAPAAAPPPAAAPSQAEFAANVAKEVAKDLLPGGPVPWVIGGIALMLLVVFVLR